LTIAETLKFMVMFALNVTAGAGQARRRDVRQVHDGVRVDELLICSRGLLVCGLA
jgi:hypothetical protein